MTNRSGTLSGDQKTRVALGKLLLLAPDILLLDEPINHMDLNSIAWLENYLLNYSGAVLIVAHDRYFLNRVVSKIIELNNGKVMIFLGNYSAYAEKKAQLREIQWKAYLNQQQEIKHQEAVIAKLKSFNREKSIRRAESREKMLDKIEILEKPSETKADMHLHFTPQILSGNDVLTVEGLAKSFPGNPLFRNLNFNISRGEKIEDRIAALEERSSEIDALMAQEEIFADVAKCVELSTEKAVLMDKLDALYEVWTELSE